MRIFVSCQQSLKSHPVPAYGFWEEYFKKGIEESGHIGIDCEGADWAEGLVYDDICSLQNWRNRTWSKVVDSIKLQHKKTPIDLFLSYLYPKQIDEGAVQEIQSLGIPCVNFFCDNVREFTSVPRSFHCFDLHWVPEYKATKMYQQAGLSYIHAPMPVWIDPEKRISAHEEQYGVSFIGSRDCQREKLLGEAISSNVDLEIRGASWDRHSTTTYTTSRTLQKTILNQSTFLAQHGLKPWVRKVLLKYKSRVPDEEFSSFVKPRPNASEYIDILQKSQVTLGINRYPSFDYPFNMPNTYSRARDIEAPMMGACYLTEWTEGLEYLYDLENEILTYRSAEEMVEKIHFLKSDSHKRKEMRAQAQKRALSEHSIPASLKKVCLALNIKSETVLSM